MRGLAKFLSFLLLLIVIAAAGAWFWAGRQPGPAVQFRQPDKFIGQTSELDLMVQSPQGQLSRLDVTIEQNGKSLPLFTLNQPTQATTRQEAADKFYAQAAIDEIVAAFGLTHQLNGKLVLPAGRQDERFGHEALT